MTPVEAYEICSKKNKRTKELENIIASSSYFSYKYARDVLKSRFEEGEKRIIANCIWSYKYSKHVLKGPFYLCHPAIFNSEYRNDYIDFLKEINYDLKEVEEWLI